MAKPSKKKRMQWRQLEAKNLYKYQPFSVSIEDGEIVTKPRKQKKVEEVKVNVDSNIIGSVDVAIDRVTESPEQYCLECGKTRYSDFLHLGSPKSSRGWCAYKICPTCMAKVEINYPDTMGGWWKETVEHLKKFTDDVDINERSILWQGSIDPMYKYNDSQIQVNI